MGHSSHEPWHYHDTDEEEEEEDARQEQDHPRRALASGAAGVVRIGTSLNPRISVTERKPVMTTVSCSQDRRNGHSLIPQALLPSTPASPEALCSVNLFFEVQGYGKAQGTGRGQTAQEAARNLAETITATKQALETPVPQTRAQRLAALLTCGLEKATAKQDWSLVERLSKAAALVLAGAVSPGERAGMLACQSQSCPSHYYQIDGMQCTCPDWEHAARRGETRPCKHVLAACLWTRLEGGK